MAFTLLIVSGATELPSTSRTRGWSIRFASGVNSMSMPTTIALGGAFTEVEQVSEEDDGPTAGDPCLENERR